MTSATLAYTGRDARGLMRYLRNPLPSGRLGQYILSVSLVAGVALVYALNNIPYDRLLVLGLLAAMAFILEWAPIKLRKTPLQGSSVSMSAAVAFAALLLLGVSGSVFANLGSALAYSAKEKRPFYKRLFTSATLVNSSALSGLVYMLAGGRAPISFGLSDFVAAGLAAGVYFLVNATLISGAVSLASGKPFRTLLANWKWLFLQMLTILAIGAVMALISASNQGITVFIAVPVLLVFPWYSIYFYVEKSAVIADAHEQLSKANAELAAANHSLDQKLTELRALHEIGLSLNSAQSLPSIFEQIINSVLSLVGADAAAIYLVDPHTRGLRFAAHTGLGADYVQAGQLALDGAALRALEEGRILLLDQEHNTPAMLSTPAAKAGLQSVAFLPFSVSGETVGGMDVSFRSEHTFTADDVSVLKVLAEQAAVAIQNARLMDQVHQSYLSTISALAAAVEAKDPYTRGHSEVVRQLAVDTGRQLGLPAADLELLNLSALFHDIGKIGIPDSLLHKPDRLTDEEWTLMRQHPLIGERILSKIPALANIPAIVRHHHERADGRGYPDGISAKENMLAAVISICDAYQAMVSDRTYRKALTHAAAVEELRRCAGTQFVPEIVEAFLNAVEYQHGLSLMNHSLEPLVMKAKVGTNAGGNGHVHATVTA